MLLLSTLLAPALAAPVLSTSLVGPSGVYVYDSGRWNATVTNTGNQNSNTVTLTIQLPVTHTSPSVYVMGTVGAKSSNCSASGTKLICNLGTIRRNRSASVYFDITLPENADPLTFTATATASGATTGSATTDASLLNDTVSFTGDRDTLNEHCTGTSLTSYYECTLFPSSISDHVATFNADHTITFDGMPDYGGSWSQPTADSLVFEYTELGTVVAAFEGYGVSSSCWEGLTEFFPTSTYVSPYRVCLQ